MATSTLFSAYFKIVPERGNGKRFEIRRSKERISYIIWKDLNNLAGLNIVNPGGNVTTGLVSDPDSFATASSGFAVKPQFGDIPDILTIGGFVDINRKTLVPYAEKSLISGSTLYKGPSAGTPSFNNNTKPEPWVYEEAKKIRELLIDAISIPTSKAEAEASNKNYWVEFIALEFLGVRLGRGGFHFPE